MCTSIRSISRSFYDYRIKDADQLRETIQLCWDRLHIELNSAKEITKEVSFYDLPEIPNIPGLTSLFSAFSDAYKSIKTIVSSVNTSDHENTLDASLRLLGAPFSFLNGLGSFVYCLEALRIGIATASTAPFIGAVVGTFVIAIESIVESVNLKRQLDIKRDILDPVEPFLVNADGEEAVASLMQSLEKIRKSYFELDEKDYKMIYTQLEMDLTRGKALNYKMIKKCLDNRLETKKSWLVRRVGKAAAHELEINLHKTIKKLDSPEGIKKAQFLLNRVKTQNNWKIFIHLIGIFSLLLSLVGVALLITGFPVLIPLCLTTAGFILARVRYILKRGVYESSTDKFDWFNLIPKRLFKVTAYARSLFDPNKETPFQVEMRLFREKYKLNRANFSLQYPYAPSGQARLGLKFQSA